MGTEMPVQEAWPGSPPHKHQTSLGSSRLHSGSQRAPLPAASAVPPGGMNQLHSSRTKALGLPGRCRALLAALPGAVVWCQEETGTELPESCPE